MVSERSNRWLYTLDLLALHGNEEALDGGRFRKYRRDAQADAVRLPMPTGSSGELQGWMLRLVQWIAEHAEDEWSMHPRMFDLRRGEISFSFANGTLATVFALTWT